MYFDAAGNLITCADMEGEIWRMDKKGNHKVIAKNYEGKILNGPNDLWINPKNGGIYITDPRYARDYWSSNDPRRLGMEQGGAYLYYLSPNSKTLKRLDENLLEPNGIVGSPDGKKLYVGNIKPDVTYVYDILKDGSLSNRQVFCKMKTDGMTIDEQGNVYLTNSLGVTAFNQKGERIFNVPTGEGWTANVVFGGKNRDLLFITAMGRVYGLKMKVKGVVK
jgi:gluconolactonase